MTLQMSAFSVVTNCSSMIIVCTFWSHFWAMFFISKINSCNSFIFFRKNKDIHKYKDNHLGKCLKCIRFFLLQKWYFVWQNYHAIHLNSVKKIIKLFNWLFDYSWFWNVKIMFIQFILTFCSRDHILVRVEFHSNVLFLS